MLAALTSPVRGMQAAGKFLGGVAKFGKAVVWDAPKAGLNYVFPGEKAPKWNTSAFDVNNIDKSVKTILKPHLQHHKLLKKGFSRHWDRLLEEITTRVIKLLGTPEVGDFITDNYAVFRCWLMGLERGPRCDFFAKLLFPAVKRKADPVGRFAMWLIPDIKYVQEKTMAKIEDTIPVELESFRTKLRRQMHRQRHKLRSIPVEVPSKDNKYSARKARRNISFDHWNKNNIAGSVKNLVEQFSTKFGKCSNRRCNLGNEQGRRQTTGNGKCKLCKDRRMAGFRDWSLSCFGKCTSCHAPWDGIQCVDFNDGNFLVELLRNLLEPLAGFKRNRVSAGDCEEKCDEGRVICPTCKGDEELCGSSKKRVKKCRWHNCNKYGLIDCTTCNGAGKVRCNNCHGTGKEWYGNADGSFRTKPIACESILYTIRGATLDIFITWITELPEHGKVGLALRNAVVNMITKQLPAMGLKSWLGSWALAAVGVISSNQKANLLVNVATKKIDSKIEEFIAFLVPQVKQLQRDCIVQCIRRRLTEKEQCNDVTFAKDSRFTSLSELSLLMQEIEDSKRN